MKHYHNPNLSSGSFPNDNLSFIQGKFEFQEVFSNAKAKTEMQAKVKKHS